MENFSFHFTNTSPKMSWCSIKVVLRTERPHQDGTSPLILRVHIGGKKTDISIGLTTTPQLWDKDKQIIKGKDNLANEMNLVINEAKARAHRIAVDYRLQNRTLTIDLFKVSFRDFPSRDNFLEYFRKKSWANYNARRIADNSFKREQMVLRSLEEFNPKLSFAELNVEWANNYKNFILKRIHKNSRLQNSNLSQTNTLRNYLKYVQKYIKLAISEGIRTENPFEVVKISRLKTRKEFLTESELLKLKEMYQTGFFKGTDVLALRVFLFQCYTGLRISDTMAVNIHDIRNGYIKIQPIKTTRTTGAAVNLKLNEFALKLVADAIANEYGILFHGLTEQKINIHLKVIAAAAGINKKLKTLMGRHTFATRFLRKGGQLHVLKEILCHSDIRSTLVYVGMEGKEMDEQLMLLD
jgi:integrase/recombinase XerD